MGITGAEGEYEVKAGKQVLRVLYIVMGIVFLPVAFCVIFIGNRMNYNQGLKLTALFPNYVLFLLALLGAAGICLLALWAKRIRLTPKTNLIVNIVLAVSFLILFFINVRIAKEIAFRLPWDVGVVDVEARKLAEGIPLGYNVYFSMYSNNVPMVYFLKQLYVEARELGTYPYVYEFVWLEVNCALISLGGFFCCLTVKRLTKEILPTVLAFLLYLALAGISPWKISPYTDTYGMAFPIMCIYFYLCYRDAQRIGEKYVFMALSMIGGAAGGLLKPSGYIVVMAVLGVELISLLTARGRGWKYFLAEVGLAAALLLARQAYVDHMMEDIGLDFNPEIEASWQNYFYMGLNEESTGSYHPGDAGIIGEFQTDKNARNQVALERAFARMEERGLFGSIYYWLRKMTMVFNDGTFGWRGEVWINEPYPEGLAGNDGLTVSLRDLFWPEGNHVGRYNTLSQLAWIFCIFGISGICLCPEGQREKYAVTVASFLGIFFYQMLFEARARYLLVFIPLLAALSVCGMWQYVRLTAKGLERWRLARQKIQTVLK